MRVAFRADASLAIGTGHVMRCLALADALRAAGNDAVFVCREHRGHLGARIAARGHAVRWLPAPAGEGAAVEAPGHAAWLGVDRETDAAETAQALAADRPDWLVVDHYALDARWETALRPHARRLLAIDDLADRAHAVDVLLDQAGRTADDYAGRLAPGTRLCLGPAYALLRPQFAAARERSLARRAGGRWTHLLVAFGGIDLADATSTVLQALAQAAARGGLPEGVTAGVVLGGGAPALAAVRARAAALPFPCTVAVDVDDLAQRMADADLAIGAAGMTAWERCAVGLPAIVVPIAANQRHGADTLAALGAAWQVAPGDIAQALPALLATLDAPALAEASRRAAALVDGRGVERVLAVMAS